MIHFKTPDDVKQVESLLETIFKRVWDKVAKKDIDNYIDSKTEKIENNKNRLTNIEHWLGIIYIGRKGFSFTIIFIVAVLTFILIVLKF